MAKRIVNLEDCPADLIGQLQRQSQLTGDPDLSALLGKLDAGPAAAVATAVPRSPVVQMRFRLGDAELSMFSLITVSGTPLEVTASERAIESFYPVDERTVRSLRALHANRQT